MVALREIAGGLVDAEYVAQEELIEEEPLFVSFEDESSEAL